MLVICASRLRCLMYEAHDSEEAYWMLWLAYAAVGYRQELLCLSLRQAAC
jgi:hypothetical protein